MRSSDRVHTKMPPTVFSDEPWATYGERRTPSDRGAGVGVRVRSRGSSVLPIVIMWAAYIVMVTCNVLFEALRLGGVTSAEVSASVFAWFTPAGYVFAIWGLIYVALFAWLVNCTRRETRAAMDAAGITSMISGLFVVSCALNVTWLILFHLRQAVASLFVIVFLWIALVALYRIVREHDAPSRVAGILNWAPISIYAAWLTVAVIANASHVATRISGAAVPLVGEVSTLVLAVVVLAAGYLMRKRYDDPAFQLVFLWAIIGVGVHLMGVSISTSLILFALSVGAAFITYFMPDGRRIPSRAL